MRDVEFQGDRTRSVMTYARDVRILIGVSVVALITILLIQSPMQRQAAPVTTPAVPAADVDAQLLYTFNVDGRLAEAAPASDTKSPYWWLNSGGELIIKDGVGETIQGDLPKSDPWYKEYADTNPDDTDGGLHPQNLLRLVSRSTWNNVRVEASYYIAKDNLDDSANRNESNGLLLMSRYSDDGQTLYYAGIRVDGTAVIKKKFEGTYYTMDQKQIFPGTYDREKDPNILPHDTWIRLRSETTTAANGDVTVKLFMRDAKTHAWKLLLSAKDDGQYDGTAPITGTHPIGLRTDFMDVKFDDILMQKLP